MFFISIPNDPTCSYTINEDGAVYCTDINCSNDKRIGVTRYDGSDYNIFIKMDIASAYVTLYYGENDGSLTSTLTDDVVYYDVDNGDITLQHEQLIIQPETEHEKILYVIKDHTPRSHILQGDQMAPGGILEQFRANHLSPSKECVWNSRLKCGRGWAIQKGYWPVIEELIANEGITLHSLVYE